MRTVEMKSSGEWSSQLWTQFMQLRGKPKKKLFKTLTGFELVTSRRDFSTET